MANEIYVHKRHGNTSAWTRKKIERERLTGRNHRERFRRRHEEGLATNFATSIRREAKSNYRQKSRKAKPDDVITVQTSLYALARRGGLTSTSTDPVKVQEALDRLRQPVGNTDSPILSWTKLEDGLVQFDFRGQWLHPPFVRVPLPLPTHSRSSKALSLYLWAMSIGGLQIPQLWQRMGFQRLCETIGIRTNQGSPRSSDELAKALHLLNVHLDKLPRAELAEHKPPIVIPDRYEIEPIKGDYVRLKSCFEQED